MLFEPTNHSLWCNYKLKAAGPMVKLRASSNAVLKSFITVEVSERRCLRKVWSSASPTVRRWELDCEPSEFVDNVALHLILWILFARRCLW